MNEIKNKPVEGRDINLALRSSSPLFRTDHGSHPNLGPGLIKREGQREERFTTGRSLDQFRSKFNSFVNKHLLDPDFFLGGR